MLRYIDALYKRFKNLIFAILIKLFVLPLINKICPVVDIRTKYLRICRSNLDIGLTIDRWDQYVEYLRHIGKEDCQDRQNIIEADYFDLLIRQRLAKVNRIIKMTISSLKGATKRLSFDEFYSILEKEFGSTIEFKYKIGRAHV